MTKKSPKKHELGPQKDPKQEKCPQNSMIGPKNPEIPKKEAMASENWPIFGKRGPKNGKNHLSGPKIDQELGDRPKKPGQKIRTNTPCKIEVGLAPKPPREKSRDLAQYTREWEPSGNVQKRKSSLSAQLKLGESHEPGKPRAANLKRKTMEEDWNDDGNWKRPRKWKLEDVEGRKKVEKEEKIEDRRIMEEKDTTGIREAIRNTGTRNTPRDYQLERKEKKERDTMHCAGKKTTEVPSGENGNCDMWGLGGRKLFQKTSPDGNRTQSRGGPLKK